MTARTRSGESAISEGEVRLSVIAVSMPTRPRGSAERQPRGVRGRDMKLVYLVFACLLIFTSAVLPVVKSPDDMGNVGDRRDFTTQAERQSPYILTLCSRRN
jgi:hypothetical protein